MEGPRWDWGTSLPIPWLNVDPTKQVKNCLVRSMLIPFRNWLLPFLCLISWWQLKYLFMFTLGKWSNLTSIFFRGEKPPTSFLWTLHTKFSDQTWSYNLFYLIQFGRSNGSVKCAIRRALLGTDVAPDFFFPSQKDAGSSSFPIIFQGQTRCFLLRGSIWQTFEVEGLSTLLLSFSGLQASHISSESLINTSKARKITSTSANSMAVTK